MDDVSKQSSARWQRVGYGGRFGPPVQTRQCLVNQGTGFGSRVAMMMQWTRGVTGRKRGWNKIIFRNRVKKGVKGVISQMKMKMKMKN